MPATKPFRSGTWARTLLGMHQVGADPLGHELAGESRPKNAQRVGIPALLGAAAMLRAGSMPSTGTPASR